MQEVAIILEKKDINEELSRLNGHLELLQDFISSNEDIGKKVIFYCKKLTEKLIPLDQKLII